MTYFERALDGALVKDDDPSDLPIDEVPEKAKASASTAEKQGVGDLDRTGKAEIEQQYFAGKST